MLVVFDVYSYSGVYSAVDNVMCSYLFLQTAIAVLLLRHSGADLLTLRNLDGQLPMDKAETGEMKTALQNYDDDSQSTGTPSFPSQS